jgi:hypothetical protein
MRLSVLCVALPLLLSHATLARAQTLTSKTPYSESYFITSEHDPYTNSPPQRMSPGAQCTSERWQLRNADHIMVSTESYDAQGRIVASSARFDGPAPERVDVMLSEAVIYRWKDDQFVGIDVIYRRQGGDQIIAKKISNYIRDKKGRIIKSTLDYTDYSSGEPIVSRFFTDYMRDALGRIIKVKENSRGKIQVSEYRYSADGLTLEYKDRKTFKPVRRYDTRGRIVSASVPGTMIPELLSSSDAAGRISLMATQGGVAIRAWSYDSAGRIVRMEWRQEQGSAQDAPFVLEVNYSQQGHMEARCSRDGEVRVTFQRSGLGCMLRPHEAEDLAMRCALAKMR